MTPWGVLSLHVGLQCLCEREWHLWPAGPMPGLPARARSRLPSAASCTPCPLHHRAALGTSPGKPRQSCHPCSGLDPATTGGTAFRLPAATGRCPSIRQGHAIGSSQRTLPPLKHPDCVPLCVLPRKLECGIPEAFPFVLFLTGNKLGCSHENLRVCLKGRAVLPEEFVRRSSKQKKKTETG